MNTAKTYGLYLPEIDGEKISKQFQEKCGDRIKKSMEKLLDDALEQVIVNYYSVCGDEFVDYIQRAALQKAEKFVEALLAGDDKVLENFLGYNSVCRKKLLDSVIDYAAKAEIEALKRTIEILHERRC